jgi:hypothetical protein
VYARHASTCFDGIDELGNAQQLARGMHNLFRSIAEDMNMAEAAAKS